MSCPKLPMILMLSVDCCSWTWTWSCRWMLSTWYCLSMINAWNAMSAAVCLCWNLFSWWWTCLKFHHAAAATLPCPEFPLVVFGLLCFDDAYFEWVHDDECCFWLLANTIAVVECALLFVRNTVNDECCLLAECHGVVWLMLECWMLCYYHAVLLFDDYILMMNTMLLTMLLCLAAIALLFVSFVGLHFWSIAWGCWVYAVHV